MFANVVVGDEINRASPKTQSALLECMEDQQVTVDGCSHRLARPFMVVATQNAARPASSSRSWTCRSRWNRPPAGAASWSAVGSGTASWHSDRLTRRLGVRVLNVGSGVVTLGMTGLLLAVRAMGTDLDAPVLVPLLLLAGAGLGTFIAPVINIVLYRVRTAVAGAASGVFTTAQRVGGAVGVAAVGVVFFGSISPGPAGGIRAAYSGAFQQALLYEVAVFAVTFLLVFLLPRPRNTR